MTNRMILRGFLAFSLLCLALPAGAASPEKLGKFGYWTSYKIPGAQPVCYMTLTAQPPIPKGSKLKRGPVTLMVTHRPAEGALDVVSYAAGTKFAPSSELVFSASGKSLNLFTQSDTAWARDAATDRELSQMIRSSEKITLTGTAAQGGSFADTIVMKGASSAYVSIAEACGLPVPKQPAAKIPTKPKTPTVTKPTVKKPAPAPVKKSSKK